MLTIGRGLSQTCTGMTRRDFLRVGGAGFGAWSLALGGQNALKAARSEPERSVILLLMVGGPSQLETFDPKPDAPSEIRGPFGSIATQCPGVRLSEHLPRLASRFDRVALIRSVYHDAAPIHETGHQLLQTGRLYRAGEDAPHLGSVVARVESMRRSMSPSMILPGPLASTGVDIPHGQSAGWLGSAFDSSHMDADRAVASESDSDRDAYGRTTFGQNCLLARRLVESGVRVVTVNMFETVFNRVTWDCHGSAPFSTLGDYASDLLPTFDRAFAALLDDLEHSGRLDSTLVVAAGEFGRTPRINANGGRDHWPDVWSVALAGGGVRGGQVIGASDAHAAAPAERPVTLPEILATIYHSLGIDASRYLTGSDGESRPILENARPIRELFG